MSTPAVAQLKVHPVPEPEFGPSLAELMDYLGVLHDTLRQLIDLAGEKLERLKAADSAALLRCAAREQDLLRSLFAAAQGRAAVVARLAQALRLRAGPGLHLREIADALPEPQASVLRARSVALQRGATELEQKNRLAAAVAHNLQSHIRSVFAAVAKACQEETGYGPHGTAQTSSTRRFVDAVG